MVRVGSGDLSTLNSATLTSASAATTAAATLAASSANSNNASNVTVDGNHGGTGVGGGSGGVVDGSIVGGGSDGNGGGVASSTGSSGIGVDNDALKRDSGASALFMTSNGALRVPFMTVRVLGWTQLQVVFFFVFLFQNQKKNMKYEKLIYSYLQINNQSASCISFCSTIALVLAPRNVGNRCSLGW